MRAKTACHSPCHAFLCLSACHLVNIKTCLVLTSRTLLLEVTFEHPIEGLTGHLAGEHEANLNLAIRPYQRCIDYAQPLRHESQPGTEVGDAVRGVLAGSALSTEGSSRYKHNEHVSMTTMQVEGSPSRSHKQYTKVRIVVSKEHSGCTMTADSAASPPAWRCSLRRSGSIQHPSPCQQRLAHRTENPGRRSTSRNIEPAEFESAEFESAMGLFKGAFAFSRYR